MGEGNSKKARMLITIGAVFMFVVDTLLAFVIVIWKDSISHLFTNNPKVVEYLDEAYVEMGFLLIIFGLHVVEAGALRGLGWQLQASICVLVAQYGFAMPLGYIFAIHYAFSVKGIWMGQIVGNTVLGLMYLYLLTKKVDWERMASDIKAKMQI
jgi:MATE family multidrug resistance protein